MSTSEQTAANQMLELNRYIEARGWSAREYVDEGVSDAKDRRPAMDELVAESFADLTAFQKVSSGNFG